MKKVLFVEYIMNLNLNSNLKLLGFKHKVILATDDPFHFRPQQ